MQMPILGLTAGIVFLLSIFAFVKLPKGPNVMIGSIGFVIAVIMLLAGLREPVQNTTAAVAGASVDKNLGSEIVAGQNMSGQTAENVKTLSLANENNAKAEGARADARIKNVGASIIEEAWTAFMLGAGLLFVVKTAICWGPLLIVALLTAFHFGNKRRQEE